MKEVNDADPERAGRLGEGPRERGVDSIEVVESASWRMGAGDLIDAGMASRHTLPVTSSTDGRRRRSRITSSLTSKICWIGFYLKPVESPLAGKSLLAFYLLSYNFLEPPPIIFGRAKCGELCALSPACRNHTPRHTGWNARLRKPSSRISESLPQSRPRLFNDIGGTKIGGTETEMDPSVPVAFSRAWTPVWDIFRSLGIAEPLLTVSAF
ncbi:hypothetical protein DFH09DRAFT_1099272 [Mycena vulgaris]|nr:hypothetical protein DFH09DRAFT_1099272 [Mycena vulgaris]